MVVVYHLNNRITAVISRGNQSIEFDGHASIALGIQKLAYSYPDEKIVWCHSNGKEILDLEVLNTIFHHNKLMLSYNPSATSYLDKSIGYVEESPFIRINKKGTFPTWQMSGFVGCIHASVLLAFKDKISLDTDFDYFLSSVAKLGMPKGLLCYSEPRLLKNKPNSCTIKKSNHTLFRFVKQHYRMRWIFLLLLNLFLYERKFPLLPFLFSLFYKNRSKADINLEDIKVQSSKKVIDKATVDVIIPTIGRKNYLYDVLKDFSKQTILPNKIIIVEQNPELGSKSELDYLATEKWPFEIQHIFIHQAGACNARNLALDHTQSEWVFLADDDNRFEATLLSDVFSKIEKFGNLVITTAYPQKNEIKKCTKVIQWPSFGAGNSFVRRDLLSKVRFNTGFEFGYGEDVDFGMQLRKEGADVLYLPEPSILHLKAPLGGFRTKPILKWQDDAIQPKPSPTIMLFQILHNTPEQISGYKTILFFKYYRHQKIKNPLRYLIYFRKQWKQSVFWAHQLQAKS